MEALHPLYMFSDKLEVDDRKPVVTFPLPGLSGTYGLLAPKLTFWVQLGVFLILQTALCIAASVLIYKVIVKHRGSTTAYLLGYGILMPAALLYPFVMSTLFDIRNCLLRFGMYTPTFITFRLLDAMHGPSTPMAELSLDNFMHYYACLIEIQFDKDTKKPAKISKEELLANARGVLFSFFLLCGLYSLIAPFGFIPFDDDVPVHVLDYTLWDILHPTHLKNMLVGLFLMFILLQFSQSFVALTMNLLGYQTISIMDSPFTKSKSPSEFWGLRWNRVTQSLLKKGVYKPMIMNKVSKEVALFATFFLSGILHEYVWAFLYYNHRTDEDCPDCYRPIHGNNIMFFSWNAVIVLLESRLGHLSVFQYIKNHFPSPIIAIMVILCALPLGHLYLGDLYRGGFFYDFQVGLPMIVKV